MVFFTWSAGKDLEGIVRFNTITDYTIFDVYGIPWMFFVFAFTVFSLNILTIYNLFKPQTIGFKIAFSAVGAALFQNVVTLYLALNNLDIVKEAYIVSRESRGMPIRENSLEKIFSETGMISTVAVVVVFYIVLSFFIYKNRQYLSPGNPTLDA